MNPDQPTPAVRAAERDCETCDGAGSVGSGSTQAACPECSSGSESPPESAMRAAEELDRVGYLAYTGNKFFHARVAAIIDAHVPQIPTVPGNQWAFYRQDENGLVRALLAIKDDDAYVTAPQDAKWFQRNGHRLIEVVETKGAHVPAEARDLESENELLRQHMMANDSDSPVAACNCMTMSPEIRFHKNGCKYRLIMERDEARAFLASNEQTKPTT